MREIYKGISTRWFTTKQNERSQEAVYNKSLDIVYCLSFKSNKIRSLREYTGIEKGVAVSSDNDVHPSEVAGHVTVPTEALVAHGDDLVDPISHQFIGLGLYSRQLIGELHTSCEDGYTPENSTIKLLPFIAFVAKHFTLDLLFHDSFTLLK